MARGRVWDGLHRRLWVSSRRCAALGLFLAGCQHLCADLLGAFVAVGRGGPVGGRRGGIAGPRGERVRIYAEGLSSIIEETSKKATQTIDDVVSAPTKMKEKVEQTIEDLAADDGRVLDANTFAGATGALAVSFAVLPYVPVSLYSSYVLLTTGSGLPPGPNGIYGLAEGLATLTVFLVAFWSLASFITRAKGLPAGPLNLLGITQALCYICVVFFLGATVINNQETPNPFLQGPAKAKKPGSGAGVSLPALPNFQMPELNLPKVDLPQVDLPKVDLPKVDIPNVDLSKVGLPKVDMPKVDMPKVDLPPISNPFKGLESKLPTAKPPAPGPAAGPPAATAEKTTQSLSDLLDD